MAHKYIMLPGQQKGSLESFNFKLGIKKNYNLRSRELEC